MVGVEPRLPLPVLGVLALAAVGVVATRSSFLPLAAVGFIAEASQSSPSFMAAVASPPSLSMLQGFFARPSFDATAATWPVLSILWVLWTPR